MTRKPIRLPFLAAGRVDRALLEADFGGAYQVALDLEDSVTPQKTGRRARYVAGRIVDLCKAHEWLAELEHLGDLKYPIGGGSDVAFSGNAWSIALVDAR